jgi:branched-chain amino acid transport system substrate-binding protein
MQLIYRIILLSFATVWMAGCMKHEASYTPCSSDDIRVAALLALTGSASSTGQTSQASLEIARQDMLKYMGEMNISRKLSLEIIDSKTDTAEALKQLKNIYNKGIRLVIGPYSSAELAAVKNFADSHDMLLVSPASVAVSLAIPGDNVFRFSSPDIIQGEAMAKMLEVDHIKAIVPLVRNDIWGNDLIAAISNGFGKSGGIIHDPVFYPVETTDFQSYLSELDANTAFEIGRFSAGEVAVCMLSFAEGTLLLSKAESFNSLDLVPWYGNSGFAQTASAITDLAAARFASTHGLPCPSYGLDEVAKVKWQPLVAKIKEKIGREPDVYAITAYDAFMVSVSTLIKTGPDPSIVFLKNVFLNEADNYFGASGPVYLDVNGDRATGNYDFWSVIHETSGYSWKRTACYNSATGILTKL